MSKQKQKQKQKRPRTYARNRAAISRTGRELVVESDGTYFLKLVIVLLLGTFWLKFSSPLIIGNFIVNGIPLGLLVGLLLIWKLEKFQFDRKIWYAVLIVITIVSYFAPAGVML